MYQEEASVNTGVRFYMHFCVCACVRGGHQHRHNHFVTGGKLFQGAFCIVDILFRGAFVLAGFLTRGLMVRWFLSEGFLPGAFDLEPSHSTEELMLSAALDIMTGWSN